MAGPWEDYGPDNNTSAPWEAYGGTTEPKKPAGAIRRMADTGLALARGVVSVPETAVGIADLVTGGKAGKAVERAGIRFKDAKDVLTSFQSDEQKAADAEVQQAEGFLPAVGAMVRNPSTIANALAETVPTMLGGGALARGAIRSGLIRNPITAGAAGEGVVTAGQSAEQVRQQTADGELTGKQAGVVAGSGAVTGVINRLSGGLANKLGIADVNTAMASGTLAPAAGQAPKGAIRRIAEGTVNEGVLQELPQSMQEQAAQNIALDRPVGEGVAEAGAAGMLVGGLMGGGVNAVSGGSQPAQNQPATDTPQVGVFPNEAPGVSPVAESGGFDPSTAVPESAAAPTKSQAMGIDPNAGPISAAAAIAVDGGAAEVVQRQQAELAAEEAKKPGAKGAVKKPAAAPTSSVSSVGPGPAATEQQQSQPTEATGTAPSIPEGAETSRSDIDDAAVAGVESASAIVQPSTPPGKPATSSQPQEIPSAQTAQAQQSPPQRQAPDRADPDAGATRPGPGAADEPAAGGAAVQTAPTQQPGELSDADSQDARQIQAVDPETGEITFAEPAAPGEPAAPAAVPAQAEGDNKQPADTVDAGAQAAATSPANDLPEPTDGQKKAGNYKVGRVNVGGMDVSIENPAGSTRRGKDKDGKEWENTLAHHYGYIKGTVGNDKDHVDAFIKPETPTDYAGQVFVIDQIHPDTGKFDEHKVMIGFDNGLQARQAYHANYAKGWKGFKAMTAMPMDEFKAWVFDGPKNKMLSPDPKEEGQQDELDAEMRSYEDRAKKKDELRARVKKVLADHAASIPPKDKDELEAVSIRRKLLTEQVENMERNYPALEIENSKGIRIGDRVVGTIKEQKIVGVVSNFSNSGGIKVNILGEKDPGGWVPLSDVQPVNPSESEDPAAGKWYGTKEKAAEKLAALGLAETHEVVRDGLRFELRKKAPAADLARSTASSPDVERPVNLRRGASSANTPIATPAPKPTGFPSVAARWSAFMPVERRDMLAKAGYTDADQARVLSGTDWTGLGESVRKALDAVHKQEVDAAKVAAPTTKKPVTPQIPAPTTGYVLPSFASGTGQRGPTVIVNKLGADGLTDAERAAGKKPYTDAPIGESALFSKDAEIKNPSTLDELIGAADAGYRVHFDYAGVDGRTLWLEKSGDAWTVKSKDDGSAATITKGGVGFSKWGKAQALREIEDDANHRFKKWKPLVEKAPKPRRRQPGDPDYTLLDARNDLIEMRTIEQGFGVVSDDRLLERIRRQEKLIADMESKAKPADDLNAMFDDVLGEELAKDAAKAAPAPTNEPDWWKQSTPTERVRRMKASGFSNRTAVTPWNRLPAEEQQALNDQWGPKDAAPDPSPKAKPVTSANTIFTEDAAAAARAILKRKLGTLNSGLDPEMLQAGITLAGYHIERGARTFAAYAKAMLDDLGDGVRPYLKSWYMATKYDPRAAGFTMDDAQTMEAFDLDSLTEKADNSAQEPQNAARELDRPSPGALDGAPAPDGGAPDKERDAGASPDRGSDSDRRGDARPDDSGADAGRGVATGAGAVPVPARGTKPDAKNAKKPRVSRAPRADAGNVAPGDAGRGLTDNPAPNAPPVAPPQVKSEDFTITEDLDLGEGGQKTKFRNNVAAIRLVRELEASGRFATPDEQQVLAKYVGWGGLPQAFDTDNRDWQKESAELADLLTPDELADARQSTRYAHYTSRPIIVDGIYAALKHFGFSGGKALESSVGTGNFIGLMPVDMRSASRFTAIEREPIASAIARHLYPRQTVLRADFVEFKGNDAYYDVAVGNPPFASDPQVDRSGRKHLSGLSLHNYFFAKSVDMLREGGILAQVVTSSFLDAKTDTARRYISERTKFLGAIRLPNNAFARNAGTEVTTDIIFLQKRPDAEIGGKAARADAKRWQDIGQYRDARGRTVPLNQYFIDNPDMMLGDFGAYGTMYGPNQPALVMRAGQDTPTLLREAIGRLPDGVYKSVAETGSAAHIEAAVKALTNPPVKEGGYFLEDGKVIQRLPDLGGEARGVEITAATQWTEKTRLGDQGLERIKALAELRATVRGLIASEMGDNTQEMDRLRADLNRQYDAYRATHGLINDPATLRVFDDDPDFPLLASLEHGYTPAIGIPAAKRMGIKPVPASAKKGAIFTQRVVAARQPVRKVSSAADALDVSMAERGKLDAAYIGELLGRDAETVLRDLTEGDKPLLFRDPATDEYVLRDAYLSGNVRAKLAQARAASMYANVRELERVQPADVGAHEIAARLGSPWIPTDVYRDFARSLYGEDAKVLVGYLKANSSFQLAVYGGNEVAMTNTWGTKDYPGDAMLSALMNNRSIKVTWRDGEGKVHTDVEATENANNKAQEMRDKFNDWLFADADRSEVLVKAYNETNNNYVTRVYDGSHMTFPGKVPDDIIKFRRHQRNAIARIVQDRTALLDHVVGAGKTFTIVAAAMEMKRTGVARKPMVAVPNHLVKQWAADFYRLYPGANVLTATKKDFERQNRRKFLAKIATSDWDAIVIAHSSYGFIRPAPDFEARFNELQIKDIMATIKAVEEGDGDKPVKKRTIKQLEGMKERLQNRIRSLRDKPMDDLLDFDQLGVDQLFVDEAHMFKNLMYSTKMQGVSGMQDPAGSQRAYDMYVKAHQIYEKNGRGQGVVFATGTPISNSLAEMYHMMRYLMPSQMKDLGFESFDAWANTFAAIDQVWMQAPSGDGFKASNRMSNFVNTHELLKMFDQVSDTVTMDDIKKAYSEENDGAEFPLPKVKTGRRIPVSLDKSPEQDAYMADIAKRAKTLEQRKGPPGKGEDNILVIMGDARKAAMDIRLVDFNITERAKGGRIDRATDEAVARYRQYDKWKGTQVVFSDLGTPIKHARAELKEYEALQARIAAGTEEVVANAAFGREDAMAVMEDVEAAQAELDAKGQDWLSAVQAALRGFSVYDDFKAALIEKGVPEAEIAFIHDFNTDDQKAGLFRKVNAGQIRFLLGSTAKLGAGTNIQERLVAEHHLDVPWRPSDVEQREGRIIRQGNRLMDEVPGFEVEILAYVTKDTLDMRMWQVQEAKLKMINQLRTRKIGREIENAFEDMELSAGEMQAAATGDINLLKEIQLRNDVKKLEQRRRSFDAQRNDLISRRKRVAEKLDRIPGELAQAKAQAVNAKAYADELAANPVEFRMTLDGKEYTTAEAALAYLNPILDRREPTGKMEVVGGVEIPATRAAPIAIDVDGEVIKNRATLAEMFSDAKGDSSPIRWTVDGTVYTRRAKLENAIRRNITDSVANERPLPVGTIGPYEVSAEGRVLKNGDIEIEVTIGKDGDVELDGVVAMVDQARAPAVVIRTVENLIDGVSSRARFLEYDLERAKQEAADLEKVPAATAWPDEAKLEAARAAHQEVLSLLKKKEATPEPAAGDTAFARSPYYSALSSEVGKIGAKSQPAMGWAMNINGLVKAGKVKQDEVHWTGILDWLRLQEGKVTKEQVAQYLDANGVRVEETVLGGGNKPPGYDADLELLSDNGLTLERNPEDPSMVAFMDENGDLLSADELAEEPGLAKELVLAAYRVQEAADADKVPTRYANYQLPGGSNYREVLLTLPAKTSADPARAEYEAWAQRNGLQPNATFAEERYKRETGKDAPPPRSMTAMQADAAQNFKSSHWDQPNVLAHIRVNDRVDVDGKKVLFVEEIQSDWGQEGKKKGFAATDTTGWTAKVGSKGATADIYRVYDANGNALSGSPIASSEAEAIEKQRAMMDAGKTPVAPFVTKTDAWLSLALKRIVKMAADGGYDRVAFVNGEQSADRYDLSKQVDNVRLFTRKVSEKGAAAAEPTMGRLVVSKDGQQVISRDVEFAELPDLIGKEAAQKLIYAEKQPARGGGGVGDMRELAGLDLKVGGEGMKAFYDKIVPNTLKDVLKKVGGGTLETVEFPPASAVRSGSRDAMPGQEADKQPGFTLSESILAKASEDLPQFSRQGGRGVSMPDAKAIVAAVRESLPTAPPIHILESVDRAPKELRADIRKAGAERDVDAAFHNGEIYVFPGNIGSVERMMFVLAHHEIRHFGLRATLGPKAGPVFLAIHATNPKIRQLAAEQVEKGYAKSRVLAVEEALADMPVDELVALNGFDKVIAALRTWLRSVAANLRRRGFAGLADAIDPKVWTDADVAALIARAEGVSRGGSARYQTEGTVFADSGKVVPFQAGRTGGDPGGDVERYERLAKQVQDEYVKSDWTFEQYKARVEPIQEKLFEAQRRLRKWQEGRAAESIEEIFPGYTEIPIGTKVMAVHGLKFKEPTRATVVGRRGSRVGNKAWVLPVVDFGDGDGRPILPGDIKEVFGGPRAPSDTRFARSGGFASAKSLADVTNTLREATRPIGTVSWWDKSVGTQYHKSTKDADFKRVFDGYVQQTDDTAHYAIEAERNAPDILRRLESIPDAFRGVLHSGAKHKADLVAVSRALFANIEGEEGIKQIRYDDRSLREIFNLTPRQIEMYHQARGAVDTSVARLAQTYAAQMGQSNGMDIERVKNMDLDDTIAIVKEFIQDSHDEARAVEKLRKNVAIEDQDEAGDETRALEKEYGKKPPKAPTQEMTAQLLARLDAMGEHAKFLQESAYMPALRFGQFAVTVTQDDETLHFEMFETQMAANLAAMKLRRQYPRASVAKSVMNPEQYAMFKGVSPETVELFAKFTGADQNEAFQNYIALAKSVRSVKMRELKRKGIAGFSDDATRVLASFLTSNARQSAINMNIGTITDALASKELARKGDVQREAQKLHEYMANPIEEARRLRSFMFMHFMGGSIASALVNLTQPVMQTAPYLHQWAGSKTASIMLAAAKMAATGKIADQRLRDAAKRAADDGITEPHEIHQLMADASGSSFGGNLRARAAVKLWGSFFSTAEAYNRRITFLAAYQVALQTKQRDPYEFARKAVIETQGLYAKVNRPNWARGAVGATIFTFKQFSIAYLEWFTRLPPKQKVLAMAMLLIAAGADGLPFVEDLQDLIDTVGQSLGYNTNSKKSQRKILAQAFGDDLGEILNTGLLSKSAVDVQGRLGMGNLIPGTELFKPSETDKTRSATEIAGPISGVITAFQKALAKAQRGEIVGMTGAIQEMAPVAVKNLLKGIDMAKTGVYKDTRGYKVADVDVVDSFVKMLGLQPSNIARNTRKFVDEMQDKGMVTMMESMIADRWAQGIAQKDPDQVAKARQALIAWNENNPDSRILIKPAQILRRVREMDKTRSERFVKTVPKELRAGVVENLR